MCCLRMSNVPLMYRSSLTSRYHKHTPILYYCRTNTSKSRSSPRTRSLVPPRSSTPTKTSCLQSASHLIRVLRCLYWPSGVWYNSTAGQQRGTEKQTRHTPQPNWTWRRHLRGFGHQRDSSDPPRWSFTGRLLKALPSSLHISVTACVFTLSNVHGARESTLGKWCQKETKRKKNQHSCDWGTKNNTLGCVTESLAFF